MSELEPAVFGWRRARREGQDESEAADRFAPIQAALDAHLGERTWLLGDTFTIPDLLVATMLAAAVSSPLGDPPASLRHYVERAQQRPAHLRAEELGSRKPNSASTGSAAARPTP